ncbi:hypothetical protein EST38_g9068 [Candolleomyces aberdarensis]|uniref:Uncharacterized protein n=1 Tax=Candolleomyces aberdarensis TaxID=2316362 RepID=A0A4Q2DD67_9AGAR|nr:hypothetical protein EST38_g9068 [Candolleomyces aberdarensis]
MAPARISVSSLGSKANKSKPKPLGRTQSYGKGSGPNPFYDGLRASPGGGASDSERAFGLPVNLNATPVTVKAQSLCTTPIVPSHCAPRKGVLRNPRVEAYVSPLRPRTRKLRSLLQEDWDTDNKENSDVLSDEPFSSPVKKLKLSSSPKAAFGGIKLEFDDFGPTLADLASEEPFSGGDVMEAAQGTTSGVEPGSGFFSNNTIGIGIDPSFLNSSKSESESESTFWLLDSSEDDASLTLRRVSLGSIIKRTDGGHHSHRDSGSDPSTDSEMLPYKLGNKTSFFSAKPEDLSPTMTEIFGEALALPTRHVKGEVSQADVAQADSGSDSSIDGQLASSSQQFSSITESSSPVHIAASPFSPLLELTAPESTAEYRPLDSNYEGVLQFPATHSGHEDHIPTGNLQGTSEAPSNSPLP